MERRSTSEPPSSRAPGGAEPGVGGGVPTDPDPTGPPRNTAPSLDGLSVAGITRRRVVWVVVALVSVWVVIVFARQVGEASTAAARVDRVTQENARLVADNEALQREAALIQRQAFIDQQARAYGLGSSRERPFRLAPGAPPLAADAPGSAALRLGADDRRETPLESWLSLLFGPSPNS
jgi:cell division protein FtsB